MAVVSNRNIGQFHRPNGKYDKSLNMCLPQNRVYHQQQSPEYQMKCQLHNVVSRQTIKDLLAEDRSLLYSDKHILAHALVYMKRTEKMGPNDLDFLAFMGLAVDMLEDYSNEIFYMLVKRFALLKYENPDNYRCFEQLIVLPLMNEVSKRKFDILKQMDFNAHVVRTSKEYEQAESIVDRLLRETQKTTRSRMPLALYKDKEIRRYNELVMADLMALHAAQTNRSITKTKCGQQLLDPYFFNVEQENVQFYQTSESHGYQAMPYKVVY